MQFYLIHIQSDITSNHIKGRKNIREYNVVNRYVDN